MMTDPTGEYAKITVEGKNMTVVIPVSFGGAASAERIMAFTRGIESLSGKVGDMNVSFRVDTSADPEANTTNQVNFKEGKGTSNVEPRGGKMVATLYAGTESNSEKLAAVSGHEGVHLAGALDAYKVVDGKVVLNRDSGGKDRLGNPDTRKKTDVMFDPAKGKVSKDDVKQMQNSDLQKLFKKENPNGLPVPNNDVERK